MSERRFQVDAYFVDDFSPTFPIVLKAHPLLVTSILYYMNLSVNLSVCCYLTIFGFLQWQDWISSQSLPSLLLPSGLCLRHLSIHIHDFIQLFKPCFGHQSAHLWEVSGQPLNSLVKLIHLIHKSAFNQLFLALFLKILLLFGFLFFVDLVQ